MADFAKECHGTMDTLPSWPVQLPLPTFDGYALEPEAGLARTDMEAGPARQRQRFTATPTRIPVRWRFSQFQYALFESWHRHKAGANWFAIDLLGSLGLVAHQARFLGQNNNPYRAVPLRGGTWIVTSVLEIRDQPVLSAEALDIALSEDVPGLLSAADHLHTALDQDRW